MLHWCLSLFALVFLSLTRVKGSLFHMENEELTKWQCEEVTKPSLEQTTATDWLRETRSWKGTELTEGKGEGGVRWWRSTFSIPVVYFLPLPPFFCTQKGAENTGLPQAQREESLQESKNAGEGEAVLSYPHQNSSRRNDNTEVLLTDSHALHSQGECLYTFQLCVCSLDIHRGFAYIININTCLFPSRISL